MPTSILSIVADIASQLSHKHDPHLSARYSWWILEAITGKDKAILLASPQYKLTPEQQNTIHTWLTQHIKHDMPLAYLIGSVPFIDVQILVEPPILIPRPETEEWVDNLITQLRTAQITTMRILDLCTGSGCIAIAFAHAFPQAQIYATDISDHALQLAQRNAALNNVKSITFLSSDLFTALAGQTFDLIVANPPYISSQEWQDLEASVRDWEDKNALIAADEGLALIKKIIAQAPDYLRDNQTFIDNHIPQLVIEHGSNQGDAVKKIADSSRFSSAMIIKDLQQNDRIVALYR